MKAKIEEIKEITEWTNPQTNKTIYYHTLLMDNEEQIQLGKMQNHAFKIDQEVDYESYTDKQGKVRWKEDIDRKWKEVTDFKAGGSRKEDPYKQMLILAQSSTHRAVELIAAGAITFDQLDKAVGKLMDIQIKLAKERI